MKREELEQVIYERTRNFVDGRVMDCIFELIAEEREACARVCDAEVAQINLTSGSRAALVAGMVAEICAEAIRARGE